MTEAILFRGVDKGIFAAALVQRLRSAGMDVGLSSTERFGQSLECCPPTDTHTLYWVARTCLVGDKNDFARFDAVFDVLFNDASLAITGDRKNASNAEVKAEGSLIKRSVPEDGMEALAGRTLSERPEIVADDEQSDADAEAEEALPELLPSEFADIADTPFDQLSADQLDQLGKWLESAMLHFPRRRSRRRTRSATGALTDLRATLASARSTGGVPIRLHKQTVRTKQRGLVMVADVSGSMESFTRIYLHLMRSLVVHGDAEVFTFSTTLRRVTIPLRERDPQAAIDRMTAEVEDRFSGTKIASSIKELVSSPVWSNAVRGSVVLIASDGWDSDSPEVLEYQLKRLRRMAHRVVWVNPRSAAQGYAPLVGAMAAALPYVDSMVSGHTLRSVVELMSSLSD